MSRRKLVYKVTYPNGKIYVGVDLIGTSVSYFGSPSQKAKDAIAADHGDHRLDMIVRKEILWESETATDAEARAKEIELIVATGANNPDLGYNRTPRFQSRPDQNLPDRRVRSNSMPRRKQIYKITYPNGKIYVGMDLTGTVLYLGSPSAGDQIAADHLADTNDFTLTIRKEILWESATATDAEVRAKEVELIVATGANNPEIGYNKSPRYRPDLSST